MDSELYIEDLWQEQPHLPVTEHMRMHKSALRVLGASSTHVKNSMGSKHASLLKTSEQSWRD